jgi:hypothetical protein
LFISNPIGSFAVPKQSFRTDRLTFGQWAGGELLRHWRKLRFDSFTSKREPHLRLNKEATTGISVEQLSITTMDWGR